jgi:replicative DNA helicase
MNIYSKVKEEISNNAEKAAQGRLNCIPFPLKTLNKYIPGIMRGIYYAITASTGVGKTKFAKFAFVKAAYHFHKEHPDGGINPKILYFLLEESKEEFIYSMIIDELWDRWKIRVDMYDLMSYREKLPQDVIDKIDELEEYFKDFEKVVTLIDTISNPTGVFKEVRKYSEQHGTHYYTPLNSETTGTLYISKEEYQSKQGHEKEQWKYSHYEPTDPKDHVIVITDHISLLSTERGAESLHAAMQKWSSEYVVMQIIKHYKYTVVAVHQQVASGENVEHKKAQALEPDLSKLGDNKMIGRDYKIVLGLFAPYVHGIQKHNGYDITKLGPYYRCLSILKHRNGKSNVDIGLYFDGATTTYKDLPLPTDQERMNNLYRYINQLENGITSSSNGVA